MDKPFIEYGETAIDSRMFQLCYAVHHGNTIASSARRQLFMQLFRYGIEFYWKGKSIRPSWEFQRIINKYWIPFSKDFIDFMHIIGIVPVLLVKVPEGEIVPVVPKGRYGEDYMITTRSRGGIQKFSYYKMTSRKTGERIQPRKDPKIRIISGYGFEPNEYGKFKSIVSTILLQDFMQNRMNAFAISTEKKRSDAPILTETQADSAGIVRPEMQYDYYGDWDKNKHQAEARYQRNTQEIYAIVEQQIRMEQAYSENGATEDGMNIDVNKKQLQNNIFPLPMNHRVARYQLPEARNDLVPLNRHMEHIIAAAYGVPRSHMISDEGRSETSVRITEKSLDETVNFWKTILGVELTEIYASIPGYVQEDKSVAVSTYSKVEIATMPRRDLFDKVNEPRVTVGLAIIPSDTDDGLLMKYSLGIIKWQNFAKIMLQHSNYPTEVVNEDFGKDPWQQEFKLSMLRSVSSSGLSSLGISSQAIFPEVTKSGPEGEEGEKKKDDDKKKKEGEKKKKDETKKATESEEKKDDTPDQDKTKKKKNEDDKEDKKRKKESNKSKENKKQKK
jgi:hypothetical protein